MALRKDVYAILLGPLVTLGGPGCAALPFQPPTDFPKSQAPAGRSLASGVRTPRTPFPAGSNGSPDIAPVGASGSPAPGSSSTDAAARLHSLYQEAVERYGKIDSYIVRLMRREQINGKDKPEETLLFKFRKEPWSLYFKWLGVEGKGREVVYVRGRYDNKIQTLLAAGDIPLMPAGKRFAVAPDSPLVLSSSRHPIYEAGIGVLIERFGKALEDADRGSPARGTLRYLGPMQRPEFAAACEAVEQTLVAGVDPQLPRGGRRLWMFDPETKFPVLVITQDESGHEVEYYCYDRFEFPVHLDDDDFNPDKLWNPRREGAAQK